MSRALRPIACVIAAAAAAAAVAAVVLNLVADGRGAEASVSAWGAAPFLIAIVAPASVGLFVALRQPQNRVAWILLVGPLSVGVVMAGDAAGALALYHDPGSTVGAWAALVAEQWPVLFLWPLALAFLYPDGQLPSARWRPVAALVCLGCGGLITMLLLVPELDGHYGKVPSPLPVTLPESAEPVFWVFWVGLLASLFGGALALRARYRAGDGRQRRQVLWLAYGAIVVPIWLGGGSLWTQLVGSFDPIDGIGLMVFQVWPAVAVWVAVTRHGLYALDRVLNRTLV
jgi:hypothetical protein